MKILDFGLARTIDDDVHLTKDGVIIGTPAFMAPEQAKGGVVDQRSDLFSLGCVLYRACTGVLPFAGEDAMSTLVSRMMDHPRPPREINAEVPAALSDLIMQMLAKDPGTVRRRPRWWCRQLKTSNAKHVSLSVLRVAPFATGGPSYWPVPWRLCCWPFLWPYCWALAGGGC